MKHTRVLAAAAALLFAATAVQAQRGRDDHRDRQDQRGQVAPPTQQRHDDDDRGRAVQSQQRGNEQARDEQARAAEAQAQRRVAQDDAQRREVQSRQRDHDDQLDRARRAQQEEQLERARRAQQEEQVEQARRRAEVNRAYDRDRDDRPGYYRYNMGGVYRETNQYGVDVLRQALDVGYQRGYRAGQMDRRDGAPADYRRALDFQNGDYGFTGSYVPESDYSYYFREGFQRGYDDAYWSRARYGTFSNGNPSILGSIVAGILGLTEERN